jgi:4-aminobutyrate aminotransferase-like enzyme
LRDRLGRLEGLRGVGGSRVQGLLAGVDVVDRSGKPDARRARRIQRRCLRNGVLVRVSDVAVGHVLLLKPPLVIKPGELDFGLGVMEDALQATG